MYDEDIPHVSDSTTALALASQWPKDYALRVHRTNVHRGWMLSLVSIALHQINGELERYVVLRHLEFGAQDDLTVMAENLSALYGLKVLT